MSWQAARPARNRAVGALIAPKSRVVDLGAGELGLLEVLVDPAAYTAVDLVPFGTDVLAVDLGAELPQLPSADYVVAQGLLEYLPDVPRFLRDVRGYAPRLVTSYWPSDRVRPRARNRFDFEELERELELAGWRIADRVRVGPQGVWGCLQG